MSVFRRFETAVKKLEAAQSAVDDASSPIEQFKHAATAEIRDVIKALRKD